jgi:hypothetical protein
MDDLVRWLTACLDEDAEEAQRGYLKAALLPDYGGWNKSTVAGLPPAVAVRVLREIDAKRRILAQCVYWNERAAQEAVDPPKYPQPGLDLGLLLDAMNPVLRLLALPYADRPGYRAEWAPTE